MRIDTVDTFTDPPFGGSPAAVCLLPPEGRPESWMQALAAVTILRGEIDGAAANGTIFPPADPHV